MSGLRTQLPSLSVVIPTRNRPQLLTQVIDALASQRRLDPKSLEVVVVDDGSAEPAQALLASQAVPFQLNVLRQPHCGVASARNAGWTSARGEVILFLDDDVILGRESVEAHRALHVTNQSRVVLGAVSSDPARGREAWNAYEDALRARKYRALTRWEIPSGIHYGGNFSVRRKHLEAVGGFDQTLVSNQDVDLGHRLRNMGLTFVFEPAAGGIHRGGADLARWKQMHLLRGRLDVAIYRDRGYGGGLLSLVACYHDRHILNRFLLRVALLSRGSERRVVETGIAAGVAAHRLGLGRLSRASMSASANVLYWAGVRDGLRGNRRLWQLVRTTRHHTGRPYQLNAATRT